MVQKNPLSSLPTALIKKCKKITQPAFMPPMLATLTHDYFSSDTWLYEHKFDGERCLAFKKNGRVRLMSRNKREINGEYPELVDALTKQAADNFIVDGEIVSVNQKGISDFQLLQGRMHLLESSTIEMRQKKVPILFNIFDCLYADGYDIRELPLHARKKVLKNLLSYRRPLVFTEHQVGNGLTFFKKACKLHWEGLIAKRIDSVYQGTRSRDWLKFKCIMKQELVIGGYTAPKGSRAYFGALLVGYYDKGKLRYAGKVGTGFNELTLSMLGKKLRALERTTCPFSDYDKSERDVHWVKPVLVAEFQFAQWTKASRLRVGRYKGLRDDKNAKDVIKE